MTVSSPADFLRDEIDAITKYLTATQEVVRSGHMPDITALEKRVENLCDAIKKSAKEDQDKILDRFSQLIIHLDSCATDMRLWKEKE